MSGGTADKQGNDYEYRFGVQLLCQLLRGELISVREDSQKESEEKLLIDFKVIDANQQPILYQCKGTSGSSSRWSTASLKDVYLAAIDEFDHGGSYSFVSPDRPDTFPLLDLAKSYPLAEANLFYTSLGKANKTIMDRLLAILPSAWQSKEKALLFLQKFHFEQFTRDRTSLEDAIYRTRLLQPEAVYDYLYSFFTKEGLLARPVTAIELHDYLEKRKYSFSSENPQKVGETIAVLNRQCFNAMATHFVRGKYFKRPKIEESLISSCTSSPAVLLTGNQGSGKTALLYAVCQALQKEGNIVFLIDMTKAPLTMMPGEFGKNFGFEESPISVFRRFYPDKTCFLVLDQLDSCLLDSTQSGILTGLCERLLLEIKDLPDVHLLMTCRSLFINEFKTLFSEGLKETKVPELTLEEVEDITGEDFIPGSPLASLLQNFLFLSLYLQLKKPKGTSHRDVILEFIKQNEATAEKRGIPPNQFECLLRVVVERIRSSGRLRVSVDELRNEDGFSLSEISAACDSHLLVLEGPWIFFAHQSIADFLMAENLAKKVFSKRGGLVDYIVKAGQESLATYDSVQQLFQLLLQNPDTKVLDQAIKELLDSKIIRPFYKEIAFSALGSIPHPSSKERRLALSSLKGKERKQCLASSCARNKELGELFYRQGKLSLDEKVDLFYALSSNPVFVAHEISMNESILDKDDRLLNDLDPLSVSDSIFTRIVASIKKDPDFFFMDNFLPLAIKAPERCYEILAAAISGGEPRRHIRKEWFQAFLVVARRLPEKSLLLVSSFFKTNDPYQFSKDMRNSESDAYSLALAVISAAYPLLPFSKRTELLFESKDNPLFQKHLLDSLTDAGVEENANGAALLLTPAFFSRFEFTSHNGLIFSFANFITRYMACLEASERAIVMERILAVRPAPKNFWTKEGLLKLRKEEPNIGPYWFPSSEDEQYLLLKDLPSEYFDEEGKRYVNYLKRKFASGPRRYLTGDEDHLSSLVSPIRGKGDSFSEQTWAKILTNPKTGSDNDNHWFFKSGISNEISFWSSEIKECAQKRPALFFSLLERDGANIKKPFQQAILNGVLEASSKAQESLPVDSKRLYDELSLCYPSEQELEDALIPFVFSESPLWQEDWVQKRIIARAERVAGEADKKEPSISDLETGALNEDRSEAVLILSNMIRSGLLPDYDEKALADSLLSSPKAVERLSLFNLLYGSDESGWKKREFVSLLQKDPEFIGVSLLTDLFNWWVASLSESLTPIFLTASQLENKEVTSWIAEYAIAYYVFHGSLKKVFEMVISTPKFYVEALKASKRLMEESEPKTQPKFKAIFVSLLQKGADENHYFAEDKSENSFDFIIESILWDLKDNKDNRGDSDILFALCDASLNRENIQRYIARKMPPLLLAVSASVDSEDIKARCFDYLDRFYLKGCCSGFTI